MNSYVIYALLDPVTDAVRYVGFTKRPILQRVHAHHSGKYKVGEWVRDLKRRYMRPKPIILEIGEGDHLEAERRHIFKQRVAGADLLNVELTFPRLMTREQQMQAIELVRRKSSKCPPATS